MISTAHHLPRRTFLRGVAGGLLALQWPARAGAQSAPADQAERVRVALTHGEDRAANIFEALRRIEPQVRAAIARKKRVILKPNVVSTTRQLSATHADCLEGILEFLSPIVKDEILIAESSASGPATEGFDNYGYTRLAKRYKVRFVDLDLEPSVVRHVIDERYRPQPVRYSEFLLDPEAYVISSAVMKTHDRAVVTLSLKNLAVGATLKDTSYGWRPGSKGRNDKILVHGGRANQGINYNLFSLAKLRQPDLAIIDGFEGMEHNGPVSGTPVNHRVAVAATDWLAADRVAVELMGFDFAKVGYLTFCAKAGMGRADLAGIEVLGEPIARHVRQYRPHDTIEQQYKWMEDEARG